MAAGHRSHLRVSAPLAVIVHFGDETDLCITRNFSLGGLSLKTKFQPNAGETMKVTFVGEDIRISAVGEVVHSGDEGTALQFLDQTLPFQMKLEDIYNRMLASKGQPRMPSIPSGMVVWWAPVERRSFWKRLFRGEVTEGRLVNVQIEGGSMKCRHKPPVGERVVFGVPLSGIEEDPRCYAEVVRHLRDGIALQFEDPSLEFRRIISGLRRHGESG